MSQFVVHIDKGEINNKQVVSLAFRTLPDGAYNVKIDIKKRSRSLLQNSYYHGILVPMVKEGLQNIGYREIKSNEQAHEVLKMLFLKRSFPNNETGEAINLIGSTADLTTIAFNDYIDQCIQWGVEYLGIQIPLPQEQLKIFQE